jgi:hypothetical protein
MENTQLTIADMASLKGLLEAAIARGAFKPNEISTVGRIYDKLDIFLVQATNQLQSQTQTQGDTNA